MPLKILIVFFLLISYSGLQPLLGQNIRVGFYNVENLFDTENDPVINDEEFLPEARIKWDDEKYQNKLMKISRVLAGMQLDIVGVSEVENRQVLQDLVLHQNIKAYGYQMVHFDSRDYRGIDVALLYRPGIFRPFSTAMLPIHDPQEPNFITRDILLVKGLVGNDTLTVFVNHWPSRRGGKEDKRLLAAQVLRNAVDSLQTLNPESNIICLGDFNDDPTNKSLKKILRAGGNVEKLEKGNLFSPGWKTFKQGYGTGVYNGVWNMFDQVIISQSLLNNSASKIKYIPSSFTIFAAQWMQVQDGPNAGAPYRNFSYGAYQNGYSDHYPVLIQLKIQNE